MALPQRKPGIAIAIGVPKEPPALGRPGESRRPMPAPEASPDGGAEPDQDETALDPAEVCYSSNDLCESCLHMADSGDCDKYHFPVEPTGHCAAGYTPKDGGGDMGDMGDNSPEGPAPDQSSTAYGR